MAQPCIPLLHPFPTRVGREAGPECSPGLQHGRGGWHCGGFVGPGLWRAQALGTPAHGWVGALLVDQMIHLPCWVFALDPISRAFEKTKQNQLGYLS